MVQREVSQRSISGRNSPPLHQPCSEPHSPSSRMRWAMPDRLDSGGMASTSLWWTSATPQAMGGFSCTSPPPFLAKFLVQLLDRQGKNSGPACSLSRGSKVRGSASSAGTVHSRWRGCGLVPAAGGVAGTRRWWWLGRRELVSPRCDQNAAAQVTCRRLRSGGFSLSPTFLLSLSSPVHSCPCSLFDRVPYR